MVGGERQSDLAKSDFEESSVRVIPSLSTLLCHRSGRRRHASSGALRHRKPPPGQLDTSIDVYGGSYRGVDNLSPPGLKLGISGGCGLILERGGLKLCSHSVSLHKGTYSSGAMNPVDFFHHMPADKKYGSLAIWQ